jgi:hypothetical protein
LFTRNKDALWGLIGNSCVDARTIFRWLFEETSYNYPGDVDTLFLPHTKDMGWTFRVDTEVPRQIEVFNCGVFLLGYVACVLYGMSPGRLNPMLIQGFLIRLFGECSSLKLNTDLLCIKRHKGSPWVSENSSRIILDPIPITPLSPNKALRKAASSTRFVLPSERVKSNFDSFQERAKAQRKVRDAKAKKQKEEKEGKKRKCVEAEKARLDKIKEEEAEKSRMEKSREAADQKVDGLLADGLAAELTKRGKAHKKKRLKTLFENIFSLPGQGGGVGEADAAAVSAEAVQSKDAFNSNKPVEPVKDQVALLVFRQGTKGIDPPSPYANNVRKCRLNPKGGLKYWL